MNNEDIFKTTIPTPKLKKNKRTLIFDLEANNLLIKATKLWVNVCRDYETKELFIFPPGDLKFKELMVSYDRIVGHNICGYDLPLLDKLFGFCIPRSIERFDTLIYSQVLDYRRFGYDGHSLDRWGKFLGFPKGEFTDFSKYSEDMLTYCTNDVMLSERIYEYLLEEYESKLKSAPNLATYIKAEHFVAEWASTASWKGWPIDKEKATDLYFDLKADMVKSEKALKDKLGMVAVAKDKSKGVVDWKEPKWTKDGCYAAHTANWFGVNPWSGFEGEERMIEGPYSRVEFRKLLISSVSDIKIFLFRHGWEPDEWNYKRDENGILQKTSPKITETSLEFLGGDGKLYLDYSVASSRFSILKGWLENLDKKGNLHGEMMSIGTPSMRARHSIIVNVPSVDSKWGKEMRSLFITKPGWKMIGCDSKGNQARGLAHYLGDEEFIDVILNGDVHTYNKEKLTAVLKRMGIDYEVQRGQAKRILYAFLFGASGAKLWSYIFGYQDKTKGNKLKKGFTSAVPGFANLLDKLAKIYGKTSKEGYGYIPSIAGNRIYVDSFHKLLVYLLQSMEKITCGTAVMLTMRRLEQANIPYIPLIMMHDEEDFMVPEEYAEQAAKIGEQSFEDGAKLYGIEIMGGDSKIGNNWLEVH